MSSATTNDGGKKLLGVVLFFAFVNCALVRADVPPLGKPKEVTTIMTVAGLSDGGLTADGSTLVLVVRPVIGPQTVTKVENNKPLSKGYKFSHAEFFFVSAALLETVKGNIEAINYEKKQKGLTPALIEFPAPLFVEKSSPVVSRSLVYTVK